MLIIIVVAAVLLFCSILNVMCYQRGYQRGRRANTNFTKQPQDTTADTTTTVTPNPVFEKANTWLTTAPLYEAIEPKLPKGEAGDQHYEKNALARRGGDDGAYETPVVKKPTHELASRDVKLDESAYVMHGDGYLFVDC